MINLHSGIPRKTNSYKSWNQYHILDVDTFSVTEIELLFSLTADMKSVLYGQSGRFLKSLRGETIINLFYEPSTRTRVSFEIAGKKLGADVINVSSEGSSVEKGESLYNTVLTLQAQNADVIVFRHYHSGAPYFIARQLKRTKVINGGDGTHAHPTQALSDMYTIKDKLGKINRKKIVIVGDIDHSRVARSNILGLSSMGAYVTLSGPATLLSPYLKEAYPDVHIEHDLNKAVENADVVMPLRLQRERQTSGLLPSLREYSKYWQVNTERLKLAKHNVLVMHPGPMNEGVEISSDVAHGINSVIEEQVTNGVALRMALLYLLCKK